eukprot:gene3431-4058_t
MNAFEHGYGVLTYPDGNRYEGNWVTSKQEGAGKKISFDGRVVEGEFKDGTIFNGKGVLVHPDGVIQEGTWVEAKNTVMAEESIQEESCMKESGIWGNGTVM